MQRSDVLHNADLVHFDRELYSLPIATTYVLGDDNIMAWAVRYLTRWLWTATEAFVLVTLLFEDGKAFFEIYTVCGTKGNMSVQWAYRLHGVTMLQVLLVKWIAFPYSGYERTNRM